MEQVTGRKLLFVDDDDSLRTNLALYFRHRGNEVWEASTLSEARTALAAGTFDAIVLDIILPDGEGLELMEKSGLPPVIILSSLGDNADMIEGFAAGACDYAAKPCSPELLEYRLANRLLPRVQAKISCHGLTIDVGARTATFNGTPVVLTGSEFNILALLMKNAGKFFLPTEIYEKIWNAPSFGSTSIKYHISNLRQKLAAVTGSNLIVTEFGKGYSFIPEHS